MTPEVWTPEGLLRTTPHFDIAGSTHPNPLAVPDYLEEAMLSDVWILLVESVVGMLFDLRMAPGFSEPNAAVLVLQRPTEIAWHKSVGWPTGVTEADGPQWGWWTTLTSRFEAHDNGLTARIGGMLADDECTVAAERAHLYLGTIPELAEFDGVPPDMNVDTVDEIRRRLPRWSSRMAVANYWAYP